LIEGSHSAARTANKILKVIADRQTLALSTLHTTQRSYTTSNVDLGVIVLETW